VRACGIECAVDGLGRRAGVAGENGRVQLRVDVLKLLLKTRTGRSALCAGLL
jgi:hypothetical protein